MRKPARFSYYTARIVAHGHQLAQEENSPYAADACIQLAALAAWHAAGENYGMDRTQTDVALARLRAAASLIPAIESDLANSKITPERAALMSEFCTWAATSEVECDEGKRLAAAIQAGLSRLHAKLD